jgi:hypothetical protein
MRSLRSSFLKVAGPLALRNSPVPSFIANTAAPASIRRDSLDLHCSWVSDLKVGFDEEDSDTVDSLLVITSITSSVCQWYIDAHGGHCDQNLNASIYLQAQRRLRALQRAP